jgi:hypothetical protein
MVCYSDGNKNEKENAVGHMPRMKCRYMRGKSSELKD